MKEGNNRRQNNYTDKNSIPLLTMNHVLRLEKLYGNVAGPPSPRFLANDLLSRVSRLSVDDKGDIEE